MGRRTRIARGVYADKFGLAATVKVRGVQRERRFPFDTPPETIQQWQHDTRADLFATAARSITTRGTFERDALKALKAHEGRVSYQADRAHLRAWFPQLGSLNRHTITREKLQTIIRSWQAQTPPVAARTIRHRVRVLRECFATFGDRSNPTIGLELPSVPTPSPAAVSLATIRTVADNLRRAGLTVDYARFLVRATTGQRPAQIMRAMPADVDLTRKIWFVRPAKGGTAVPLPLNAEMVTAWETFTTAKAWGSFDTTKAARVLRQHGWPAGVRPYALRHTFAIDVLLGGTDLSDVQGLLGHRQIETTRTFYGPILAARLTLAVEKRAITFLPASAPADLCQPLARHNAKIGQKRPQDATAANRRRKARKVRKR